jgi:hypothetical protein
MKRFVKFAAGAAVAGLIAAAAVGVWGSEPDRGVAATEAARPRTALVDGIESGWTIEEFLRYLRGRSLAGAIERGRPSSAEGRRPPHVFDAVRVRDFSHLGVAGSLDAHFLDNRLAEVTFYPGDPELYLRRLSSCPRVARGGPATLFGDR